MAPLAETGNTTLSVLQDALAIRIPGSRLTLTTLPLVPEIQLHLLNGDYPRHGLAPELAQALMDDPPYWSFCWASGQVLARCILDQPARVRGKTLVDFGAGSGVVGIAALLAGAAKVIVCDQGPFALQACRINAQANGVCLHTCSHLAELLPTPGKVADTVTVADVFYDRDNLPLLETFQQHFLQVLVADSRLKGQPLPGMASIGRFHSHTVPDLDESREFNRVTLYQSEDS